jgi:DNA-binding transcriptional LysR family regulator
MFLRAGVVPVPVMELDSMEAMKHMVTAGLGVAVLPEISVRRELERGELKAITFRDLEKPVQREVGLHVPRNRLVAPAIKEFLQLIAEEHGLEREVEAVVASPGSKRG